MKRKAWLLATGLAIATWGPAAGAESKVLASIFFAASHPIYSSVIVPWGRDVEKATGGEVKIEYATTSLAPPPGQLDMVQRGIADLAIQFSGVVPNRLTLTLIGEQFGPTTTSQAMSVALWRTYKKFFESADEYKGFKLISLVTFPPQRLYTVREPILSIEQLKRSKVAVTPGTLARAYSSVTTGVIAIPAIRFFELVSKGTVDAFVVTPIEIYAFNLIRSTKQSMTFQGTGTVAASFAIVMNEGKWSSLGEPQRKAIDALSGEAFARRMVALDEAVDRANKAMKQDGVQFLDAPASFNNELKRAFALSTEEWIAEAGKRGVDGRAALEFYWSEHVRLADRK